MILFQPPATVLWNSLTNSIHSCSADSVRLRPRQVRSHFNHLIELLFDIFTLDVYSFMSVWFSIQENKK